MHFFLQYQLKHKKKKRFRAWKPALLNHGCMKSLIWQKKKKMLPTSILLIGKNYKSFLLVGSTNLKPTPPPPLVRFLVHLSEKNCWWVLVLWDLSRYSSFSHLKKMSLSNTVQFVNWKSTFVNSDKIIINKKHRC